MDRDVVREIGACAGGAHFASTGTLSAEPENPAWSLSAPEPEDLPTDWATPLSAPLGEKHERGSRSHDQARVVRLGDSVLPEGVRGKGTASRPEITGEMGYRQQPEYDHAEDEHDATDPP